MYTITLTDGTKLKNLKAKGKGYLSPEILSDEIFENNLSKVTISNGNGSKPKVYTDMSLISNSKRGGKSWFVLKEKPPQKECCFDNAINQINMIEHALNEVYAILVKN
jgi:hypothetical protein